MARNTRWRVRLVLFAGAGLLVGNAVAQLTCYNTRGEVDANQQPCVAPGTDPSATTWCCSQGDTCLSNGLCLSPASSNLMTQQGCTDKNWGGSCKKYCPASDEQKLAAIPLIPCPTSFDSATNNISFCCGPDPSSCCEKSSSWISLPAGTTIPSQTTDSSSSSSSNNNSYSLKIGLGIGLGIGVPILLVLLAVAYLLAQPVHSRRRRRNNTKNNSGSSHQRRKASGLKDETMTEKTSDTARTYPPRSYFGNHHARGKSFGQVDTRVRPSTGDDDDDDGHGHGHGRWPGGAHHAWPPPLPLHTAAAAGGASGLATALAQWARSPFGFGGMEPPPPSPKEMDAAAGLASPSGGRRGRGGSGDTPSRLGAAELPSPDLDRHLEEGGAGGVGRASVGRGWKAGRRVHVAAEEVELPTPDTPRRDVERGLGRR